MILCWLFLGCLCLLGGEGTDTLYAADGLTKAITSAAYDGIEIIDLSQASNPTQADDVHVSIDDVLSAENDLLTVLGDGVDEVLSTDFTTDDRVADITDGGVTYAVFQDSNATLQIELGVILNGETLV